MKMQERQKRYAQAVERLADQTQGDETLLGLYVYGSAHRGDVWEHSDIDVVIVTSEEQRPWAAYALVEDGILVAAEVCSRSHFRKIHERSLRGSSIHAIFTSGDFAYTSDPALEEYIADAAEVGARDLDFLRMRIALSLAGTVHGITKALKVRCDLITAFRMTIHALEDFARLLVLDHDQMLCREVVSRAHALDPSFSKLWTKACNGHRSMQELTDIERLLVGYLSEQARTLFKPLFDYLSEEPVVRTASDIQHAIGKRIGTPDVAHGIGTACEFLADCKLIKRTTVPVRLTRKGRAEFDEAAYFLGGT